MPRFLTSARILFVASTVAASLGLMGTVRAGSFREALGPLAEEIKQVVIDDQRQTAIQVGEFSGKGQLNCGPGLCEDLKLALNKSYPGICQPHATLVLKGEYEQVPDPRATDLILLQVAVTIRDTNGRKIAEKSLEVRDTGVIATALGLTVALPSKANREVRNQHLQKALKAPSYHVQNTIIRARQNTPYGVEVLVAPVQAAPRDVAGWSRIAPRAPVNRNGEAYVPIAKNEVFALRIHNDLQRECAVSVAVDGVDSFAFSDVRQGNLPHYKYHIFPTGTGVVPGWHRTNQISESFLVTEYGKGAASKVGLPARGKVGVITCRFALAWTGDNPPPEEVGARDGGNETGFGPAVKSQQKDARRKIGVAREVISIRYSR